MSVEQGIELFFRVIPPVAAAFGVLVAYLGLNTWQQKIRWEQGRGLAVSLLQSYFVLKNMLNDTRRLSYTKIDDALSDSEKSLLAQTGWERAKEHDRKLNIAFGDFQRYVAEAIVVWSEDLSEVVSELHDLKHIASSLVLSGAETMDHTLPIHRRIASASLHEAFHGDFYGNPEDRRGVSGRLKEVQVKLKVKIAQQRLN